jgi:hypothetical protein
MFMSIGVTVGTVGIYSSRIEPMISAPRMAEDSKQESSLQPQPPCIASCALSNWLLGKPCQKNTKYFLNVTHAHMGRIRNTYTHKLTWNSNEPSYSDCRPYKFPSCFLRSHN